MCVSIIDLDVHVPDVGGDVGRTIEEVGGGAVGDAEHAR